MFALIRALAPSKLRSDWYAQLARRCDEAAVGRGVASLFDQAIVSGTSFLTTLVIGRACLPEQLGLYSVGFSVVLGLMVIPRSLIWTPYTTFVPTMSADDRRSYSGSALLQQVALGALLAFIVSAVGVGLLAGQAAMGKLLIILGPAMVFMFLREHVRRVCFAQLQVSQALVLDMAIATAQVTGLLLLAASGMLTAVRAYAVVIVASAPALTIWVMANKHSISVRLDRMVPDFLHNWGFAGWVLTGSLIAGFGAVLDPLALSLTHGNVAVGIYSAAFSLIKLANPMVISFINYFGPHLAHAYARSGMSSLRRLVMRTVAPLTLLMALATGVVALWGGQILGILFGADYAQYGAVVTALMLGELFDVLSMPFTLGLSAAGRGRVLLGAEIVRTVIASTLGLWFIYEFGPIGMGYSRAVSTAGSGLYQGIALWGMTKDV